MKFLNRFPILALLAGVTLVSCSKSVKDPETPAVSQEVITKLKALGYGTNNVQKVDEGYLVEGDMIITPDMLDTRPTSPILIIANEEQYRTTNLVTGLPRTITVSAPASPANFSTAVNNAIARYNAENLQITFQRVNSGGNIDIKIVNTRQYIASAGFPSGGNPFGSISYAKTYSTYGIDFMTTVIAHEMGHCIGFRHTDYMNRAYSCGSGGNEGDGGVGAIHISGTPTGVDPNSWMLACLSATTNRPFNANDKTALNYLY